MKHFAAIILLSCLVACNSPENQKASTDATTEEANQPLKMDIKEEVIPIQYLMVMEGKAANTEELGQKLENIFGKITACSEDCKMEGAGAPMAWYNSQDAPWTFTAGMPFTTPCPHPEEGISLKELPETKAVVGMYFGPYDEMQAGYMAIESYMKEKNLEAAGSPYEVYIGDPMTEKDPYKVQTNIVHPVK